MQGFFLHTTYAIALKLQLLIGHHQMTLKDKSLNSYQILTQLCPFFGFEMFVKVFMQDFFSQTTEAITLKLHTIIGHQPQMLLL